MVIQPKAEVKAAIAQLPLIPSATLRESLIRTVEDINKLIVETEAYTPGPELVKLVNNFFSYLVKSTESRSTLIRRACWMSSMAHIVKQRLLEFQYQHICHSAEDLTHVPYADLVNMVSMMSEELGEYAKLYPPGDQSDLLELMETVVENLSTVKSGQDQHYYKTLSSHGRQFMSNLNRAIAQKRIGLQIDHSGLMTSLYNFNHRMLSYRNRRAA